MSKRVRALLILIVAVAVCVIAGLTIYRLTRPYTVLFSDLNSDDMAAILNYLDANNVTDYKVQNNDRILVPEGQEANLRARILMENYSGSSSNYNLYLTNINSLSSDSDRRLLQMYDLQERLGATIENFPGVKDATVFITQGQDSRYILSRDEMTEATADVTVEMNGSQTLTDQQATAIRNMVSHAVLGLVIDNVSINDTNGNIYSGGGDSISGSSDAAQLKLALESQVNANIRRNILQVLTPIFGLDNLSVSVNCTVDISRTYKDSLIYEEPDWAKDGSTNGQGIIGSRVWANSLIRGDGTTAGGVVGTSTNADLNEYVVNQSELTGDEREIATSGEINYDVTQHQIQTDTPAGTITDVMVAVAINSSEVEVPSTDPLIKLVARSAGIGEDIEREKIEIMAYPFYVAPEQPSIIPEIPGLNLPMWMVYALIAGLALFLLLLILIVVLVRRSKKRKAAKKAAEEAAAKEAALAAEAAAAEAAAAEAAAAEGAPTEGADIMDIHTEKSMELRKALRQFAEENPAIAAQMIRNWLKGGEENA